MSKSILADDLHVKGSITSKGDIQLNGAVEGEISARSLLTEDHASIRGSAIAERVVHRGNVVGNVYAEKVKLTSSASVQGEVESNSLSVDNEARFDGISNQMDSPVKDSK